MQILHGQNNAHTSFSAGNVNIRKIKAKNILQYDAIKKIAEDNNVDIFIKKLKESKYIPESNFYIVHSKRKIDECPHVVRGTSTVTVNKYAKTTEISAKIYDAVFKSIEDLSSKIQKIKEI